MKFLSVIFIALTSGFSLAHASDPVLVGRFMTTFYYVANEKNYPSSTYVPIETILGDEIARVRSRFKQALDIEGTGILINGITVNYAGKVDDEIRYRISTAKWGWGVGRCQLQPYHTVAVDPGVIPLGTVLFIPQAKGMRLPNGSIHDGTFYAQDVGEMIDGKHVDLFAQEDLSSAAPFIKAGILSGGHIDIYKLEDPDPNGCQGNAPDLADYHPLEVAARVHALKILADKYASQGQTQLLNHALNRLQELRAEWENDGKLIPSKRDIAFYLDEESMKADIEVQKLRFSDLLYKSRYPNEFNGSTLGDHEVVLTFDDGPDPVLTPQIQTILEETETPASFFEIGEHVKAHPELTQALVSNGFIVGNHSFNHPQLTKLSDSEVLQQIDSTQGLIQNALEDAVGFNKYYQKFFGTLFQFPRTIEAPEFFRSPYGDRDDRTMKIISSVVVGENYFSDNVKPETLSHIMWSEDSLDWNDPNPKSIENRVFNQLNTYNHRGIILFHDIHPQTVIAIQSVIPRLKSEGYRVVSLYEYFSRTFKK